MLSRRDENRPQSRGTEGGAGVRFELLRGEQLGLPAGGQRRAQEPRTTVRIERALR